MLAALSHLFLSLSLSLSVAVCPFSLCGAFAALALYFSLSESGSLLRRQSANAAAAEAESLLLFYPPSLCLLHRISAARTTTIREAKQLG